MAVPTVLRNSDYAAVDFTNKANGTWEVLRDAIVNKFGWNLEFEDTTTDKVMVVSNKGSGYMAKIYTAGDFNGVYIETAQSWSDINSPINKLVEQYFYVAEMPLNFVLIGDSKRFYLSTRQTLGAEEKQGLLIFLGDIKPFKDTDPNVFIYLGQKQKDIDTSPDSTRTKRGVIIEASPNVGIGTLPNKFSFFGDQNASVAPVSGCLYSPGYLLSIPNNLNPENLSDSQPTYLSPLFLINSNVDDVSKINVFRGLLPGAHLLASQSKKILQSNFFDTITVSGIDFITVQGKRYSYRPTILIALNDWDL